MNDIGLKNITSDNWLKPDDASAMMITHPEEKLVSLFISDAYISSIENEKLMDNIPIEIRQAFEVAKGAMVYGYFFYPLFTIGLEHLYKVAEIALKKKCQMIDPKKRNQSLNSCIEFLSRNGHISKAEEKRWHLLRKLRNSASHPESQPIWPPGTIIGILPTFITDITNLFSSSEEVL